MNAFRRLAVAALSLAVAALSLAVASPAFATSAARTRILTWPNPSKAGGAVQMRAEVDGLGGGAPTGNLRFADGFAAIGVSALSPYGAGQGTLAAGDDHSCVLTSAGGVACWGANTEGELGDGTTRSRSTLLGVRGLASGGVAIAAGYYHSCALTGAGAVKCWGLNMYGQLGDGTDANRRTPVAVSGLSSGVVAIATGSYHSCALTRAGAVACWGWSGEGQVGDGSMGYRLAPVAARGLSSGVVAIAGGEKHSCALTSAGAVKCWGWNFDGQIGDGTWNNYRLTPTAVSGLSSGVVAITAGERHSCALTSAGAVKCWGSNSGGQIGDGTQSNIRLTPVAVSGLSSGVVAITAGGSNTCALTSAGAVKCWGFNSDGELGDGTTTSHFTPVPVSGLSSGIVAIATGRYHSCAVTGAGALKCWGANFGGQLGDGTNTRRLIPTTIRGMTTLVRSRAFLSTGALGAGAHTLRAGFRGDVRHSSSIGAIIQTVE